MKKHNWLFNYSNYNGIASSLRGLHRRAMYMPESSMAMELFLENQEFLNECFHQLWFDLKEYSKQQLTMLIPPDEY